MAAPSQLLSPSFLRRLEQLELTAQRRSMAAGRGERRSRARGQSVEFADHRNYVPGDDLRYLDWNLYGRLDRLFVKLYEEERELPVQVFLDASESMTFGTPPKFELARRLAAAFGYLALCGFDRVSVRLFPEPGEGETGGEGVESERVLRSALLGVRGKKAAAGFLENMARVRPGGPGDFNEALRRGALGVRQPGVGVVIGDLLDPRGYAAGLDALVARGFHLNVVQILAPEELNPTAFGDLRLVDSETGGEREVTFGRYRLKAYRQAVESYTQALKEYCRGRGIHFFRATSDASIETLMLREFREAAVLG